MIQAIAGAGELSCGQVGERFPVAQPTISHHLKILHDAGLLLVRREAQHAFISIDRELLGAAFEALEGRIAPPAAAVKKSVKTKERAEAPSGAVANDVHTPRTRLGFGARGGVARSGGARRMPQIRSAPVLRSAAGAGHRHPLHVARRSHLSRRDREGGRARDGRDPTPSIGADHPDPFRRRRRCEEGDALFTIDPRPYQAKLDAAAASVARQKAVLELAKVEFGRFEKLAGTKAISESDYDTKKNAIALAEAQLLQNQAALDAARIDLDYCSILSPIDGRAGQRLVDQGNVVNAGSGTLLVIQRLDPIYADFSVPEGDLSSVQSAMARGKLRAEVRFPDDPNDPREGELTFLDNAVVDGTGMVKLRATIPNGDLHFWPGRFVKVRLVLSHLEGAVLVSTQAPQTSATGSFVYVVKPDSTAEMRPIVLGQRHGDFIVVTSGLQAGERVVVTGQLGIMPGGKVRIDEPSAPPRSRQPIVAMNLSEPFIRRPVMTAVSTASVVLFGILSYLRLPVNDLPAVDYPVIQVQADYPGRAPRRLPTISPHRSSASSCRSTASSW